MSLGRARLRAELRDLFELVLVPGLAAVLPWSVCFRIFRWVCGSSLLYRADSELALAEARSRGWVQDEATWLRKRRLVTLVDHADLYLARTRSDAWMKRHLDVEGQWSDLGEPAILCTFHWGAGMWGLRHARSAGLSAHALIAPVPVAQFAMRRVRLGYILARYASVKHALGFAPLDVSASLRPALRALRAREQVLAAVDVPSDQVSSSQTIDFLDLRARVPRGLLRVAADQRLPVVVYLTGLRLDTGRRFLRIYRLPVMDDVEALIVEVFRHLDRAVREEPAAWHFWTVAERFFARTPTTAAQGQAAGERFGDD